MYLYDITTPHHQRGYHHEQYHLPHHNNNVEFQDDDGEYVIDDIVLESVATEYKPGRA